MLLACTCYSIASLSSSRFCSARSEVEGRGTAELTKAYPEPLAGEEGKVTGEVAAARWTQSGVCITDINNSSCGPGRTDNPSPHLCFLSRAARRTQSRKLWESRTFAVLPRTSSGMPPRRGSVAREHLPSGPNLPHKTRDALSQAPCGRDLGGGTPNRPHPRGHLLVGSRLCWADGTAANAPLLRDAGVRASAQLGRRRG